MATVFLINFVRFVLIAFEIAIIGRVLLSWVEPRGRSTLSQFLVLVTEPVLAPVRRFLPSGGGLDFAPLIVMLILGAVVRSIR
ncbi:MAG: YggT family protein [Chloroflexi bacterium]|nr:YggT family protein [Chloroflexota bacterium]